LPTYTQANQPLQITTPLGQDALLLASFSGREAMSEPFEFRVQMYSDNGAIDPNSLLRQPATVSLIPKDGTTRYFHGIFRDFAQGGFDERSQLYVYEGTLVPSGWFLSLAWDCRIFQNKSVPDIVEQVLKDWNVTNYKLSLTGTYAAREYCVQYRESVLNFISRLLEEEGIAYFFVHEDGKHTLTLTDQTPSAPQCAQSQIHYSIISPGGNVEDSVIFSLNRTTQVFSPKAALTDYYFETPSLNLLSSTQTTTKTTGTEEKFDYPGRYTTRADGDRYSKIRIQELETYSQVVRGESNVISLTSGCQFALVDHYRSDMNASYLVTEVNHKTDVQQYVAASRGAALQYTNDFTAIPLKTPFRPPRRAMKPIVTGSQTAVVVGPSGEEIYVDKYARVKVQFFWDRVGKKDENSSCWVRVSQIWAGKNWGWMTIPRIGQEVVIDFLEGDPDRPLIVGRIYNAEQMPPYTLPDNSTQSGLKSRSSKSGSTDNFNEIRFEDKKGSEQLYVHAEKDMLTEVENDDTQSVDHDRTITVKGKHTETITGDTTITIKEGNHSLTLNQGNQSVTLDQGNQSTKISMGDQSTKVSLGSASHEAMQQIELKVGQSSIVLDQSGVTIKGLKISIEGTIQLEAKAVMTTVSADGIMTVKGALTMIN